jgi:hypothetical protein
MTMELYQEVALTRDLPEYGLRAGEEGCVLEVFNAIGESFAVIAVPIFVVEVLRPDEILTVRPLAKAS